MAIKRLDKLHHSQQGVVLIVGLIMVLLISLIALAAIRGSGLQEAMVGNMRGRNLAFQAAESALKDAEDFMLFSRPSSCDGVVRGRYRCLESMEADSSVLYFEDNDFIDNGNLTVLGLQGVSRQPLVVLEELTSFKPSDSDQAIPDNGGSGVTDIYPYRVSAQGVDATGTGRVVLQSTYNLEPRN